MFCSRIALLVVQRIKMPKVYYIPTLLHHYSFRFCWQIDFTSCQLRRGIVFWLFQKYAKINKNDYRIPNESKAFNFYTLYGIFKNATHSLALNALSSTLQFFWEKKRWKGITVQDFQGGSIKMWNSKPEFHVCGWF